MADEKQPLAELDSNAMVGVQQNAVASSPKKDAKPAPTFSSESQQEREMYSKLLQQKATGKQDGHYVSPSDQIMSPASAKLNAFKERRIARSIQPRMLFAKPSDTSPLLRDTESLKEPRSENNTQRAGSAASFS
ncbi:MAG: hypothetical protein Q9162_003252 [Coniocarpon cinnabarinum]